MKNGPETTVIRDHSEVLEALRRITRHLCALAAPLGRGWEEVTRKIVTEN